VKPADRTRIIDEFQAGKRRLLFVQAHSGGIGINLTAAQTAIYYTRGWSLEDYLQSQDRLHRIGQQGTVNIIHLVATGTIDEQIAKSLTNKSDLSRRITGDMARALATDVLRR
jgi:SNF2 family DNA or RNA helicase